MHCPVLSMPWLVPPRPDRPGHFYTDFYGLWQRGPQGQWDYVRKPTEQLGIFQSTSPLSSSGFPSSGEIKEKNICICKFFLSFDILLIHSTLKIIWYTWLTTNRAVGLSQIGLDVVATKQLYNKDCPCFTWKLNEKIFFLRSSFWCQSCIFTELALRPIQS